MPLETVWPDGKADLSRTIKWSDALSSYTPFQRGDILLPKISPTFEARRAMVADIMTDVGLATSEVHVLRPRPGVSAKWLSYVVRIDEFIDEGTESLQGVGNLRRIGAQQVRDFAVPTASSQAQQQIAAHLDREIAEIDAMGNDLDRLLDLLLERRSGVGSSLHAMGYESVRLKWLLDEVDLRAGDSAMALPLLSVSIHDGVQLRDDSAGRRRASGDLSNYKVAAEGQLILNRMRAFQGGLGVAPVAGLVSPDYSVLSTRPELESWWAGYVMRSPEFVDDMSRALRGIGSADQGNVRTPRINVRDLLDLEVPLPPLEDQRRILERLDDETSRIDAMITDARKLKALLAKRRSTLITDVISGRKEVT